MIKINYFYSFNKSALNHRSLALTINTTIIVCFFAIPFRMDITYNHGYSNMLKYELRVL